jgi:hypothetical protein
MEFLDIHVNKKYITCHDYHGFTWQNINTYPILTIFLCDPTPFLVCCITTTPINSFFFLFRNMLKECKEPSRKLEMML